MIESILAFKAIKEQSYLTCRSLLKLSDTYSSQKLEEACHKACQYSQKPSYKSVHPIGVGEFGVGNIAYTNMFLLEHGERYPDLHLRSEAEYRLFMELKRRVKQVDYSVKPSGFVFEGKRIEFVDRVIRFSDGENMIEVPIEEFERRPGARFRGMMEKIQNANS